MKRIIIILFISIPYLFFSQNKIGEEYMNGFIVVADSSHVYKRLKIKMFDLKSKLNIEIDTLGREYNKSKNLISLRENNEDEMYAGNYFPRRYPSKSLSLEYLDYYDSKLKDKTIGLVTGIFDNKNDADRLLTQVKEYSPNAFIMNVEIYMGCMH